MALSPKYSQSKLDVSTNNLNQTMTSQLSILHLNLLSKQKFSIDKSKLNTSRKVFEANEFLTNQLDPSRVEEYMY